MKKLCMSELLGGRILEQFYPIRQEEIVGFVQLMQTKAEKGEKTDVGEELIKLANNVISRMTMSQSCTESEDEARHVSKLVREIAELTGRFNLSDYFGFCKNLDLQGFRKRLKEVRDRFDEMIEKVIREHQEGRRKRTEQDSDGAERVEDILDVLLDIEADEKAEMKLSRENIKAFILDIFSAGTDTSAITTEWALAELINHPDQMRKARAEIDSIVGKTKLVQESDIPSLPYLQAIIKETLRLHPAGPIIIRESTQACTVAGYQIPAQTRLFVNVWSLNRDPTYWVDPLEFRPERFMDSEYGSGKSNLDVRGQHFQLLPFGSGRRGCPGISLALQVVQTSLAAMVQCFEWKVDGDSVDMEEGPGLTLPRAHPLVSTPIPRLNPFPSI